MIIYEKQPAYQDPTALWLMVILLAALIGFGLGSNIDWPDRASAPSAGQSTEESLPDWHGNVKRSQGG